MGGHVARMEITAFLCLVSYTRVAQSATDYGSDDSRQGLGYSLLTTPSRPALGPTHLPTEWLSRGSFPGVERPGRETAHSYPSSFEVKNS
jgi:hypothetical protein